MGDGLMCHYCRRYKCVCPEAFNDDMIRRGDLPSDAFALIHDLCYHHDGRDVYGYVKRAQEILATPVELRTKEENDI